MKHSFVKYLFIIILTGLTSFISGCQVARGERSISQYSADAKITAAVKNAYIYSKDVPASSINVQTDKGVVLLSGFVKSDKQKQQAVKLAKHIKGVKAVKSNLTTYQEAHSKKFYYKTKRAIQYE